MAQVNVPAHWSGIDISRLARGWRTDGGVEHRVVTSAAAASAVSAGINHLAGRAPRVTFAMAGPHDVPFTGYNAKPYYSHYYSDAWDNAPNRVCRALVLPRNDGEDFGVANPGAIKTNYESGQSAGYATIKATATWPTDLTYIEFVASRTAAAGGEVGESVDALNGMRIIDLVEQDMARSALDSDTETCALSSAFVSGGPIVAGQPELQRAALHEVLAGNLPIVFQWHAASQDGTFYSEGTAISTHQQLATAGAWDGSDWINVIPGGLSTGSESRTAWSPGFAAHGYRAGRGLSNSAGCRVYLLAKAVDGNATVKVVGPDHRASNEVAFSLDEADAEGWYKSDGLVYLNTEAEDNWTNTGRNKFDVLVLNQGSSCGGPEYSNVYIHGIVVQREYA